MSLRPPDLLGRRHASETGLELLGHEIMAEKANALGRAGRKVEETLAALQSADNGAAERAKALRAASDAVWAYFLQRELCGMRRHDEVIREYAIPREVLVRLGAR